MFDWLSRFFGSSRSSAALAQAHMTFGQTSVGRSISRAGSLLRKQLWIWPILAVIVLAVIGFGVKTAIERTMNESLRSELQTLLSVERSMLEKWLKMQESNAVTLANDQQVRKLVLDLLAAGGEGPRSDAMVPSEREKLADDLQAKLAKELEPAMSSHGFAGYVVANKSQQIVAAFTKQLVGTTVSQLDEFVARVLEGSPAVSPPFPSILMLKDKNGRLRSGTPVMFAAAPVRDENLQVVAVLAMRIRPEQEFTNILQLGRVGSSGETYAFNKAGTLVSNSRFDEELMLLGLLPDTEDSQSILNISLRDPGGDMTRGFRPKVRRAELPLCKPVITAIGGTDGVDVDGYRGYRGVLKVGAWAWLPRYEMGVITEINHAEAFRPLTILRWAFFSLFGLLIASSIAILAFTVVVARLQREAQKAAIEAKQLGQYRLESKLGSGAMGVVYKGHHAMLRRPTAIKMLNVDSVNESSIQRFEREVQITCQLNNPSTVAIYDYGRTPEGVFYYAMEFLDGIDLQALVDRYGPQTEGRVIAILKQICSSLYEAHSLGLVHRDIKPANIMLNRRGGEPDVVKVLDFGLVKALDDEKKARQTGGLAGTPLYMSPESIQTPDLVDARSDLYAVGAVGYFLLTGQPVFHATTLVELCAQQVTGVPDAPSQRLGRAVSIELESALLACLEKSRSKRPQTARDLAQMLDRAPTAHDWTIEDADAWWGRHDRQAAGKASGDAGSGALLGPAEQRSVPNASGNTAVSGFDRTIGQ
jgi:predicted Ser/Thr protein kinase